MEIPVKKNEEYIVGEGIAKIENYTIFVNGAIKGEKVKILILKTTTSYAFAKILEIINASNDRKQVDCLSYSRCGGCNIRHIDYLKTLELKRESVQNLVNKELKEKIKVQDTVRHGKSFLL